MAAAAMSIAGCLEPESNFQEPTATSTTGASTSGTSEGTTSTSSGGGVTTAQNTFTTTTTGDDSSSSSTTDDPSGGTGTSTGGDEPPDNACLVKDSYSDLGLADDALGFFVDSGNRSIGVDVFLTDSQTEPFDTVIVELVENTTPFVNVPQPGIYDIDALGGLGACGGVCVSLHADAVFDAGFVDAMFVMRATSGTLTITDMEWDGMEPTNGSVEGYLQDVVFEEVDAIGDLVVDGCRVTLDGVSFSESVTSVVPL